MENRRAQRPGFLIDRPVLKPDSEGLVDVPGHSPSFRESLRAGLGMSGVRNRAGSFPDRDTAALTAPDNWKLEEDPLYKQADDQMRTMFDRINVRSPQELSFEFQRATKERIFREWQSNEGLGRAFARDIFTDPAVWAEVALGVVTGGASVGAGAVRGGLRVAAVEGATAFATSTAREAHKAQVQTYSTQEERARAVIAETAFGSILGFVGGALVGRSAKVKAATLSNMKEAEKIAATAERSAIRGMMESGVEMTPDNYVSALKRELGELDEGFRAKRPVGPLGLMRNPLKAALAVPNAVARGATKVATNIPGVKHLFETPVWEMTNSNFKAARVAAHLYSDAPIAREGVDAALHVSSIDTRINVTTARVTQTSQSVRKLYRQLGKDTGVKDRDEFMRLVYEANSYNDNVTRALSDSETGVLERLTKTDVQKINEAAKVSRALLDEIHTRGANAGMWSHQVELDGTAETYVTRAWDSELVRLRPTETRAMVTQWAKEEGGWTTADIEATIESLGGGKSHLGLGSDRATAFETAPGAPRVFRIRQDFEFTTPDGQVHRASELMLNDITKVLDHHAQNTMREIMLNEAFATGGTRRLSKVSKRMDDTISKFHARDATADNVIADPITGEGVGKSVLDRSVKDADNHYLDSWVGQAVDIIETVGERASDPPAQRTIRAIQTAAVKAKQAREELYDSRLKIAWLEDVAEDPRAFGTTAEEVLNALDVARETAKGLAAEERSARALMESEMGAWWKRGHVEGVSVRKPIDPSEDWRWTGDETAGMQQLKDTKAAIWAIRVQAHQRAVEGHRLLHSLNNERLEKIGAAKSERARARIEKEFKRQKEHILLGNNRARAINPLAMDPSSVAARASTAVKTLNYSRLLGSSAISSAQDLVNLLLHHNARDIVTGGSKWARGIINRWAGKPGGDQAIRDFFHALEVKSHLNRLERFGGLSDANLRAGNTIDSRIGRKLSEVSTELNLMSRVNKEMKVVSSLVTQARMTRVLKKGRMSAKDIADFEKLGINGDMIARFRAQVKEHGQKWDGNFTMANIDDWTDVGAANSWERALSAGADQVVVTPGVLDRPAFMDAPARSVIFQFSTFMFAHFNKVVRPAINSDSASIIPWMVFGLAAGGANQALRDHIRGVDPDKDLARRRHKRDSKAGWAFDRFVDAVDRFGVAAPFLELNNYAQYAFGAGIDEAAEGVAHAAGFKDFKSSDDVTARYRNRTGLGNILGPTADLSERVARAGKSGFNWLVNGETPTQGDWASNARILPMNNMAYLEWLGRITSPMVAGDRVRPVGDEAPDSFVRALAERLGSPAKRERK